ncbi:MAG: hypothetical protein C4576_25485 [Desulfobacteraceae bacterium]|nr:MAG: hypothetical protein C4576_25485 [Desulfobacteraceae bacterium]
MTASTNDHSLFPALNFEVASSFAYTWAAYWTFMKKIVLYRPSVLDYGKKYLLHFELSEIVEAEGFKERDKSFVDLLQGPDALIWLGTGDKFKDVYNVTPSDNFFEEWRFTVELPENIDTEHRWTLFQENTKNGTDYKSFIRRLRLSYSNDNEITIQEPGKTPIPYDCTLLGFRSSKTKAWKAFREILLSHGRYRVGSEAERKILDEINKKLVSELAKRFGLRLPKSVKLYRRDHSEKYQFTFIFQVGEMKTEGADERAHILGRLEWLATLYREALKEEEQKRIMSELRPVLERAYAQKWITLEEAELLLRYEKNIEKYDPHENEEM